MVSDQPLTVWIGFDGREAVASYVASHSIQRRTRTPINLKFLKHRDLRKSGHFARPWLIEGDKGDFVDLIDSRPFTTEFSHTRFLIPALQEHKGWALFMDADMLFLSDIKHLFSFRDPKYAVMCVKHRHMPPDAAAKMDGRLQYRYHRKNWSSFVLWNCEHPSNHSLTTERVNFMKGSDLHAFSWLQDEEIGSIPFRYNYISGVSPALPIIDGKQELPSVIHYTEGGPWFDLCKDVPYANYWKAEYEDWCRNATDEQTMSSLPSTKYDRPDRERGK